MVNNIAAGTAAEPTPDRSRDAHSTAGFWALTLGSLGVVYGDIGTSPLYALREAVVAAAGAGNPEQAVLGVLSLILWALLLVVTAKYVLILLHLDNHGEGGTLALMALAQRSIKRATGIVFLLGVSSAALFYGDAVITPAISVLSAVEGLKIVAPGFDAYVVPITILILCALFLAQSRGTAKIATFFGPIMVIWFVAIAAGGLSHVADNPDVLRAINPIYGISFLLDHGMIALITLGLVFLAVTGAEALYADLGHFGRKPIQLAWTAFVLPSLVVNYFGQGALVLANPSAIENPFYLLYPDWAQWPMVLLATAATVIASQAVITGAYSLTRQAIQLGLLPRLEVRHTSEALAGQIYIPRVNILLFCAVLLLVATFHSSSALASAYGIAVTGTMLVDATMGFLVIWSYWHWPLAAAAALMAPFQLINLTFFAANLLKIPEGAWLPLVFASLVMTVMYTWRRGTKLLFEKTRRQEMPLADLVAILERKPPVTVPGTAVFLTSDPTAAPTALLHSLKHYKVLHEKNVILTIETANTPRVLPAERISIEPVGNTFSCMRLRFGFMETPNVPRALALARRRGWQFDIMSTSFFLSRRSLRPAAHSAMPRWQDRLFIRLSRFADDASVYFHIPTGRVVEVGTQVTI